MLYLSCQEILFFNHVQTEKRKASQRFPSPVGESYFSITSNSFIHCISNTRFRPLSGNLIFQWEGCAAVDDMNAFPSPVGESYFSISERYSSTYIVPVSVPCRGILFFNRNNFNQCWYWKSFRPLSGNLIFQWSLTEQMTKSICRFPSPIGESYFSIVDRTQTLEKFSVSVPYRGILFFNIQLDS